MSISCVSRLYLVFRQCSIRFNVTCGFYKCAFSVPTCGVFHTSAPCVLQVPHVFHQCPTGVPPEFYEFHLTFRELNKMFPVLYLYSIFSVFHVVHNYFLCSCFVPRAAQDCSTQFHVSHMFVDERSVWLLFQIVHQYIRAFNQSYMYDK